MQQRAVELSVGPQETTAQLLARLEQVPPGSTLLVRLANNTPALRKLDDFNDLRQVVSQRELHLTIASPEKVIVGLAKLLGFEVVDGTAAAAPAATPAGAAARTAARPTSAAARPAPSLAPPNGPKPAAPSAPPPQPMTENEWLFSSGQAAEEHGLPADRTIRATATSGGVRIVGSAPDTAGRATAPDAPDDISAMNFDDAELERNSAPFRDEAAANSAARATQAGEDGAPPAPRAVGAAKQPGAAATILGGLLGRRPRPATNGGRPPPRAAKAQPATRAASIASAAPLAATSVAASAGAGAVAVPVAGARPRTVRTVPQPAALRNTGLAVVAALVTVLVLGLIAWLVLPPLLTRATVVVHPASQTITDEVDVPVNTGTSGAARGSGLAAPPALDATGQISDTTGTGGSINSNGIAPASGSPVQAPPVTAQRFSADLSAEGVISTTGTRDEPAGADRVTLTLVNRSLSAATIAGGTTIVIRGVSFQTVEAATVAAAQDTGLELKYGIGSVAAQATEPGPHTVPAYAVDSTFGGTQVRFYNTTAASGGYMKHIPTVVQEDVDKLRGQLFAQLQPQVNGAILGKVPPDMQAIIPTLSVPDGNWRVESVDPAVGQDGDTVHMKLSVTGSVDAYKPGDVDQAVQNAVAASVQASGDGGPSLGGPVTHGPLELVANSTDGQITYRTVTTATIDYTLTSAMQEDIRQLVRGKPLDQARQAVLDKYGRYVRDVDITASFLNFTQTQVPDDLARIEVLPDTSGH